MVVPAGLTVRVAPVPAGVPLQEPVNHSQVAPVPKEPPVTESVLTVPKQVLLLVMAMPVGTVETLPVETASVLAPLVPQELEAVTVTLPFWPVLPAVTVMELEPCPDVIFHPVGTVQL